MGRGVRLWYRKLTTSWVDSGVDTDYLLFGGTNLPSG
jgi:hypothetical protein